MVEVIEKSDLLEVKKGILCHQVNCIGIMGGGIALQIRNRWPFVYNEYAKECAAVKDAPSRLLGQVQDIVVNDTVVIANCFGQIFPGHGIMTDYKAWDSIIPKLKDLNSFFSLDLHFPFMIGCGLAGGDWLIMQKKLEDAFAGPNWHVFIHKLIS